MRYDGDSPEKLGIGGEDDIDDCDSMHGEDVSQELISVVVNKELPPVVQKQPMCVYYIYLCKTRY
jgi:hypothetical protein